MMIILTRYNQGCKGEAKRTNSRHKGSLHLLEDPRAVPLLPSPDHRDFPCRAHTSSSCSVKCIVNKTVWKAEK